MPAPALPDDAARVIEGVVDKYADELVELRRDLHAHPELSFAERRTTDLVETWVRQAGFRVSRPTETGLVAEIGEAGGRAIGLRADLDALPVDDTTGDPWASTIAGVAHACGHDAHTAGLVGAALALAEVHDRLAAAFGHRPGEGAGLVLTVHDELVAEVPADRAEEGAALVVDGMAAAGARVLGDVPSAVDVTVGRSWAG